MDQQTIIVGAALAAILLMSMGGGDDKTEKPSIVIDDDDKPDWPVYQMDDYMEKEPKKPKQGPQHDMEAWEYEVRTRMAQLQAELQRFDDKGSEILLSLRHNVALLEKDLREAVVNSSLSPDKKTIVNFRFQFERTNNQLLQISDRCSEAMAEAARIFDDRYDRGATWQREINAIRNENYHNQGPDQHRIDNTLRGFMDGRDKVLRNFATLQEDINHSIDRFAEARELEYDRQREADDRRRSKEEERRRDDEKRRRDDEDESRRHKELGKGSTFDDAEQEREFRAALDRRKTHGFGTKRPPGKDSQDDSRDSQGSQGSQVSFVQGEPAKKTDEGKGTDLTSEISKASKVSKVGKPKPNFKQGGPKHALPNVINKFLMEQPGKAEIGIVEMGHKSHDIQRKIKKFWDINTPDLRAKFQNTSEVDKLHALIKDQFDGLDTHDPTEFERQTGHKPSYYHGIYKSEQTKYTNIMKAFAQAKVIRQFTIEKIHAISKKTALHLQNFKNWYQQSPFQKQTAYADLERAAKTPMKTFVLAYEEQKKKGDMKANTVRQMARPDEHKQGERQGEKQEVGDLSVMFTKKLKPFTALHQELKEMEKTIVQVGADYGAGSFFKDYNNPGDKKNATVRKMVISIDAFLSTYRDKLSKQALAKHPKAKQDRETLEKRWRALLEVPWYISQPNPEDGQVNVGREQSQIEESWHIAIRRFGDFESRYTSPEFLRARMDVETVKLNYERPYSDMTPTEQIQITILYMIKAKLDRIRLNSFGMTKGVQVLGKSVIDNARVKFPDTTTDGRYNTIQKADHTGGGGGPPDVDTEVVDLTGEEPPKKKSKKAKGAGKGEKRSQAPRLPLKGHGEL